MPGITSLRRAPAVQASDPYSESRKAIRASRSAAASRSKPARARAASFVCRRTASSAVAALPSCKQGTTEPQPPQRWRPNLPRPGARLPNAVTRADVVQQQIREQRDRPPVEQGIAAPTGHEAGHVAGRAADGVEHPAPGRHPRCDRPPGGWGEQPHERLEIVDAAPPGGRLDDVLRIGRRIAELELPLGQAKGQLLGKQVVGYPHLVAIGIGPEVEQRRALRLPAEATDPQLARHQVGNERSATADPVAVEILGIRQRFEPRVGNRLDQAGAEQGDRDTLDDDVGLRRDDGLAGVGRDREDLEQRAPARLDVPVCPVGFADAGPSSGHRRDPANGRHVVAARAARVVVGGTQPLLGVLHLQKVLEAEHELLELDRRQSGQRIAGKHLPRRDLRGRRNRQHQHHRPGRRQRYHLMRQRPPPRHRASAASWTTMAPRMKLCPAPHSREHSNS